MSAPVAIVTGGAGGLGQAIASALLADGFRVALLDRRGAREAAGRLGESATGVTADVTDEAAVRAALDEVEATWGRIDALVDNAGIESRHSLEELDPAAWRATLEVNLTGPALLIKHCVPRWRRQGGGRLVLRVEGRPRRPDAGSVPGTRPARGHGERGGTEFRADPVERREGRRRVRRSPCPSRSSPPARSSRRSSPDQQGESDGRPSRGARARRELGPVA